MSINTADNIKSFFLVFACADIEFLKNGSPKATSGLQILGKRYEIMLLTSHIWQNPNVFHSKNMVSK